MSATATSIRDRLFELTRNDAFKDSLAELLCQVVDIDTSPNSDIGVLGAKEAEVFDIFAKRLEALSLKDAAIERKEINPAVQDHPFFSNLYFTQSEDKPEGLTPEETYNGRYNMLYTIPGQGGGAEGRNLAVNAHIDIVHPWFASSREGDIVKGRGSCDDKGSTVALVVALELLSKLLAENNMELAKNLVCMLVVEEETGGNGSLSLALDRELKERYESMLVLECADSNIHPANRGAVWYKTELNHGDVPLLELASFVVEEMEKEGRAIRSESRHDLFPQRPVQTCHGMIGPYGEHPSRINGEVPFRVIYDHTPTVGELQTLEDVIAFALTVYTGIYGDWTVNIDEKTGKPKVDHHYDLTVEGTEVHITVHGSTGHMGAIFENDCAITKMAWMVQGMVRSRAALTTDGSRVTMELLG
ncbi:MAG: M20/M25/M40 family metallo-hydrolase, partial [Planctomycetota bacterium]